MDKGRWPRPIKPVTNAPMSHDPTLYRLCSAQQWRDSQSAGHLLGNADDVRDGFLHLSRGAQVQGTAQKYYMDVTDLTLLHISASAISHILRWETSRQNQLFPHVYGTVPLSAIMCARHVPQQDNQYFFPREIFV